MKDMKKIFAYILAVAAFVGCATDINDVVTPSVTLTAPMEVAVAESRVFDADLNWSWESSDVIAAYQNAGDKSVNALTLNEGGNFYNEAFTYATEDVAAFHFVYPAAQLASDYSLTVAQTGVWSPILYGTVEAATVKNIGAVEMNYLSSAFELRIWENGRQSRKNITKAIIASGSDFVPTWSVNNDLTYTQTLSGKELSLDLNGDTAIFNLGEGDYTFTLTLTDTEGETLSWELPSKNFVAGKRTVLNVEWKAAAPIVNVSLEGVNSWYEEVYNGNTGSALEGGYIYLNGLSAEGGEPTIYVDGATATVVDGKIAVASGVHTVYAAIGDVKSAEFSITVCKKPVLTYTVYSSYNSNDGSVSKNNQCDGRSIYAKNFAINEQFLSSAVSSVVFYYGSESQTTSLGGSVQKSSLNLGDYKCYAIATVKINGNALNITTASTAIAVTGLPYTLNVTSNDGTWDEEGYVNWNTDGGVRLGYTQWGGAAYISRTFHIPADLTVKVSANGIVNGTGSIVKVENTATVTVGSTTVVSKTQKGNSSADWSCSNASASMSSSNNTVKCNSSYNLEKAKVVVKALTIQY